MSVRYTSPHPQTGSLHVAEGGLELTDLLVCASQVLGR